MTGLLDGDVAIVTGAGRNIGRATAERFAEEGASLVVADIDEDRADETVDRIEAAGGEAIPVIVDVSDKAMVQAMVDQTVDTYGTIDILVNNVSISDDTDFFDLTVEEFDDVLSVNLRGMFLCTQATARVMRDSGGGRIVNVSSTSAHWGRPTAVAYATSKSGILNFTRSAAQALTRYDIRVNTLSPYQSGSPVGLENARTEEPESLAPRWGTPEDQANAALFLVSPWSDFVNGTELVVDGGTLTGALSTASRERAKQQ